MSNSQLILMVGGALVLLVVVAKLTGATLRRALAGVVGGVAGILCGVTGDLISYHLGLWEYSGSIPAHAPPLAYIGASIATGAFALVGWPIGRRFGLTGLIVFVLVMGLASAVADAKSGIQILHQGLIPHAVDADMWIVVVAVAQVVMRLVAGRTTGDGSTPA